ncbi:High-affinity proline transporter PutP [Campylobacter majalis]|uniref:Sodium/proline symporter n=1 Tax=Campylobacter majalis TaxID=2790656 RepID=A0ABN7K9I7_9BACT|nr:sodium/proline symporter PutP [Campylobacter majalis]CAD7289179.1 High-affinity proline transporter PutP [Campylobacter majalis]
MEISSYFAITLYFGVLLSIGWYAYNKSANMSEYLLDNRKLGPVATALSAGASDMSGWMLLGVPGAFYASGLSNIWMLIGLVVGAYCNYLFLAKRLRVYTEVASNSITIPDFLENRFKDRTKVLRIVSGMLILIFFTLYVSSGIIAGGKTFESFFGLPFWLGAFMTFFIVVFYTFFGGFKAVYMTDVFQGTLMFLVLIAIPTTAFLALNLSGETSLINEIRQIRSEHLDPFYNLGFWAILGLMSWGLGYFGQPHIIVRFMAIRSSSELAQARRIGIGWMVIGLIGAMSSGFVGFVFFTQGAVTLSDPEVVFLKLGETLFHPFFIGIVLSAVLSAIMSTVASQLLVSASSVTKDFVLAFYKREISAKAEVGIGRCAVVIVAMIATIFAFTSRDTVLGVVGNAWAGFGASFGPVLLFSLYYKRMSALAALAGMVMGGVVVVFWIVSGLNEYVYELLPGFIASSIVIVIVSVCGKEIGRMSHEPSKQSIKDEFDRMQTRL